MDIFLSILVYIGVLMTNKPYQQQEIDAYIQGNMPTITAVEASPDQMAHLHMYHATYDQPGFVVVLDAEEQ